MATYHEAELAGLVEHVTEAIERYDAGELDVYDVDEVIHRYHKATRHASGATWPSQGRGVKLDRSANARRAARWHEGELGNR